MSDTGHADARLSEILVATVADYSKDTVTKTYQSIGFMILITGWVLTSEDAQKIIRGGTLIPLVFTVGVMLSTLVFVIGLRKNATRIKEIHRRIRTDWGPHVESLKIDDTDIRNLSGAVALASLACCVAVFCVWA